MAVPNGGDLPADATIIFLVSGGKTRPRNRGNAPCAEIDQAALKCDDDGISVTWVELFNDENDPLASAALATRGAMAVRKSGYVARITVGALLEALADEDADVRVVLDIQPHNKGHCLITGVADHDEGLKAVVAEAFTDFVPTTAIAGLVND